MTQTAIYVRPDGPYIVTGEFCSKRGCATRRLEGSALRCVATRRTSLLRQRTMAAFVDSGVASLIPESTRSAVAGRLMMLRCQTVMKCIGPRGGVLCRRTNSRMRRHPPVPLWRVTLQAILRRNPPQERICDLNVSHNANGGRRCKRSFKSSVHPD